MSEAIEEAKGGYDPGANPRALQAVSEQGRAEVEQEIHELQRAIDMFNRQTSMFNSAGWKSLRPELENQIRAAVDFLASDSLNTMEGVAFVRGQIRAFQYLLALEQTTVVRRQVAQEEMSALRSSGE